MDKQNPELPMRLGVLFGTGAGLARVGKSVRSVWNSFEARMELLRKAPSLAYRVPTWFIGAMRAENAFASEGSEIGH